MAGVGQIKHIYRLRTLKQLYKNDDFIKALKKAEVPSADIEKIFLKISEDPKLATQVQKGRMLSYQEVKKILKIDLPPAYEPILIATVDEKMFGQYNLRVKRLASRGPRKQGGPTCSLNATCNFLEHLEIVPRGSELDERYLEGFRIWERLSVKIRNGTRRMYVSAILEQGNAMPDAIELIQTRLIPYRDPSIAQKLPDMTQPANRKKLEDELRVLFATSEGSLIEKQKRLI